MFFMSQVMVPSTPDLEVPGWSRCKVPPFTMSGNKLKKNRKGKCQWSNLKTLILNSKILIELKNVQSRACRYSSKHVQNHKYRFLFLYFIWNFPNLQVCVSSVEPRAFLAAVEAGAQMVWSQTHLLSLYFWRKSLILDINGFLRRHM